MRPPRQASTVKQHLDCLEHQVSVLTSLITQLNYVIEEGKAWLDEKESNSSSFVQIVQQLDGAMTAAFSRYLEILSENNVEPSLSKCFNDNEKPTKILSDPVESTSTITKPVNESNQDMNDQLQLLQKRFNLAEEAVISLLKGSKQVEKLEKQMKKVTNTLSENHKQIEAINTKLSEHSDLAQHIMDQEKAMQGFVEVVENLKLSNLKNCGQLDDISNEVSQTQGQLTETRRQMEDLRTAVQDIDNTVISLTIEQNNQGLVLKVDNLTNEINFLASHSNELAQSLRAKCTYFEDNLKLNFDKIVKKIQQLEILCVSRPVAFTAHLDLTKPLIAGTVVKNYCRVSCNNGNCFHPDSGVFTVPEGGLYLLGISIDEKVAIGVVRERPTNNDTEWICQVNGQAGYSSACNVCSVNLNPGDKIYLKVVFVDQNICSLSHYSCFTCVKL
ncbi:uncharacterized protein LOC131958131 [Physella acuta]|uniref:uncharacterized protein LOC131958131 n=1 Tax=Physella acuta TaxID=109671 RepID=UPI0027DB8E7A|nr:uncharacterized protein LOC131958131 [Physella acuta]